MESWRLVWRTGMAPQLSVEALTALQKALTVDDPRVLQNNTCAPPPLECVRDRPVEAACVLGFCGVESDLGGFGVATVAATEEFFAQRCFDADLRMGEPTACRWFLNWWDDNPRDEVRRELLAEVDRELALRSETDGAAMTA